MSIEEYDAKRMKLHRKLNPINDYMRKKRSERHKKYYAANKEKILKRQKAYRLRVKGIEV